MFLCDDVLTKVTQDLRCDKLLNTNAWATHGMIG